MGVAGLHYQHTFLSVYTWMCKVCFILCVKAVHECCNLLSFSSAEPDFSGSAVVIHLLCTGNMVPLCCYVNLKTSLACPMIPTFGNTQTIFLRVLTNSSVVNNSLVSCFDLRAEEPTPTKYLLFFSLCQLCS